MNKSEVSSLLPLCRLCGVLGQHKIDIFDGNSRPGDIKANILRDNIFRCVDVRVERDDESTKVCEYCFGHILTFVGFRGICAATNSKMQESQRRLRVSSDDVIDEIFPSRQSNTESANTSSEAVLQSRYPSRSAFVEYISLIGEETDSENDEIHASREITNETQTADVLSLNGKKKAAMHEAEMNSVGSETHNGEGRGPNCSANAEYKSPVSQSGEGAQQAFNNNVSRGNATTANSAFIIHGRDVMVYQGNEAESVTSQPRPCSSSARSTASCVAMNGDETNAYNAMIAVSAQIVKRSVRNGELSSETKKQAENKTAKNASNVLIKCRAPVGGGCKESFGSWDAMMFHVETYHAKGVKRTFHCHLCTKTSKTKRDLQRHMNSLHSHEIRFICPIQPCAKIFTRESSLRQHTNAVHIKRVSFRCTNCPMEFYRKEYFTRHLANQHGVGMTFSCYLCKKKSCDKYKLQRHMNSLHIGQVHFTCPFPMCSKSFTHKSSLNSHTNAIHTKNNVFKCPECDKEFYRKDHLTRHFANKH